MASRPFLPAAAFLHPPKRENSYGRIRPPAHSRSSPTLRQRRWGGGRWGEKESRWRAPATLQLWLCQGLTRVLVSAKLRWSNIDALVARPPSFSAAPVDCCCDVSSFYKFKTTAQRRLPVCTFVFATAQSVTSCPADWTRRFLRSDSKRTSADDDGRSFDARQRSRQPSCRLYATLYIGAGNHLGSTGTHIRISKFWCHYFIAERERNNWQWCWARRDSTPFHTSSTCRLFIYFKSKKRSFHAFLEKLSREKRVLAAASARKPFTVVIEKITTNSLEITLAVDKYVVRLSIIYLSKVYCDTPTSAVWGFFFSSLSPVRVGGVPSLNAKKQKHRRAF